MLGLLAGAGRAHAAEPQVAISIDPCVPVDRAQLERLLAIELGTSTARGGSVATPTRVWVGCTEQGIELRLEDAVTRKSMTRSLPASSFTNAESTRLLALAIAEFVVASWIELSVQPEPTVQPIGPELPKAARSNAERVVQERAIPPEAMYDDSLSAALAVQIWSRNDGVMFGGGLRWWQALLPSLAWAASGEVAASSVDASFGAVDVTLASLALALAWRIPIGRVTLYTGPGGRVGLTHIAGAPRDATQAEGKRGYNAYGGVIWLNRVEYRASRRLRLGLEIEPGLTTLPVDAVTGGTRAAPRETVTFALDGFWLTSSLTVGVAF
jgi:hypothetical protein